MPLIWFCCPTTCRFGLHIYFPRTAPVVEAVHRELEKLHLVSLARNVWRKYVIHVNLKNACALSLQPQVGLAARWPFLAALTHAHPLNICKVLRCVS